jgi:hypothetical protein
VIENGGYIVSYDLFIYGVCDSELLSTTANGTIELGYSTIKAMAGHTQPVFGLDGGFANIRSGTRFVGNGSCIGFYAKQRGVPPHVHNGLFAIVNCSPNVRIDNAAMIINGSFLGGGVSGGAAVGWEVHGSRLTFSGAYNVAGGTTNIMLDGVAHTYAELAGAGDEIISLAGSSMLRTA